MGDLSDQGALDRWATEQAGGLIDHFPLTLKAETELMLASAFAARVGWRIPFDGHPRNGDAPDDPSGQWLRRTSHNPADAAILDGTLTHVAVSSTADPVGD